MRTEVAAAQRIVIKLGTRVVTHDDGRLALSRLYAVVETAAALRRAGRDVLIVSSGAVGLGIEALAFDQRPTELADLQACAAVGQSRLMSMYREGFSRLDVVCGQVLLTQSDFDDRDRYLNLRATLLALLGRGVVPVINENDAVATEELRFLPGEERPVFGDNDGLSALVATKLGADLLILLTDVDGLHARDPRTDPTAPLLHTWEREEVDAGAGSSLGRGGMGSKLAAALVASKSGCHAVIANGRTDGALQRVVRGEIEGTWFPPAASLGARRRWIAFATAPRGVLHLDDGAVRALRGRGASLLAAGVKTVDGTFERGDVVELRSQDGTVIGRGMVHCGSDAARRWAGGERPDGVRNHHALVHRDQLVLEA
jgi:glutamate 5-kinase